MPGLRSTIILCVLVGVMAGCNSASEDADAVSGEAVATETTASPSVLDSTTDEPEGRLADIAVAVTAWATATNLTDAKSAAEEARNLVVGPSGPYFGDADDDGHIAGARAMGLLPGIAGEPGIVTAINQCVERDVLGGVWTDPADRWQILARAITEWTPTNNTFPSLPSHPMRIVGWATLTLATSSLDAAHEYAGHAQLHVDIAARALVACS